VVVRIICGRWVFPFAWMLVAFLALGVPGVVVPALASAGRHDLVQRFLAAWVGLAVAVDVGWCGWRMSRWRAPRPDVTRAGDTGETEDSSGE
jgi:hypothetical protein